MKHGNIIEKIYEDDGGEFSFFTRLEIAFHILGCKNCAREAVRYEEAREIMHSAFFTDTGESAETARTVMALIDAEAENAARNIELQPESLSVRDWAVAGIVIVAALITVFFGMDFGTLVKAFGSDFTIPLALVIGLIITAYIAVFIGGRLKTLTERFGLNAPSCDVP